MRRANKKMINQFSKQLIHINELFSRLEDQIEGLRETIEEYTNSINGLEKKFWGINFDQHEKIFEKTIKENFEKSNLKDFRNSDKVAKLVFGQYKENWEILKLAKEMKKRYENLLQLKTKEYEEAKEYKKIILEQINNNIQPHIHETFNSFIIDFEN